MGSSLVPERTNSIRRKRFSSDRTVSSATLSRVLAILSSPPFFLLILGSGGGGVAVNRRGVGRIGGSSSSCVREEGEGKAGWIDRLTEFVWYFLLSFFPFPECGARWGKRLIWQW